MYSMKKYLLLFLCLTLGVAYAQDTLRVRVMTYNLRFGELASLEELAHHIKSFKPDFVALQEVDSKTSEGEGFYIRTCLSYRDVWALRKND